MRAAYYLLPAALFSMAILAGCNVANTEDKPRAQDSSAGKTDEDRVAANLAKLSPEDRKLAEEQKFCAVEEGSRLGSMGAPVKVMVNDQPVFVCCKSCAKHAQEQPEATLERVKELKAKAAEKPAP